jgi:hypothetical protein
LASLVSFQFVLVYTEQNVRKWELVCRPFH